MHFVRTVGASSGPLPAILLQPWAGLTTAELLRLAGGREPRLLPAWLCRTVIAVGHSIGRVVPELAGLVRRIEMLWLGQRQSAGAMDQAMEGFVEEWPVTLGLGESQIGCEAGSLLEGDVPITPKIVAEGEGSDPRIWGEERPIRVPSNGTRPS